MTPTMTTTCTKRYSDIPFAHRQPVHDGHCRHIHGHNWSFEFEFAAEALDECGFVVDFGKLAPLKAWLDKFDHALVLNQDDPLLAPRAAGAGATALEQVFAVAGGNLLAVKDCSCEGLAKLALVQSNFVLAKMTAGRARVVRATVWEDSKNSATARADYDA